MASRTTERFRAALRLLPAKDQQRVRDAYRRWNSDTQHPGLQFKRVGLKVELYSARVDRNLRALTVKDGEDWVWFWLGAHDEYDKLVDAINSQ